MDLRHYFRKMREIEANIADAHPFVTSLETSDGGKAGVVTEVSRELAAKMITEGCAALSTEAEKERFLEQQSAERASAQKAEMARRLQVTVVTDSDAGRFSQHPDSSSLSLRK
ncbi:MAG: hypothetical protein M3Y72_20140 [Acidobacteriota bacterium]|nr:hypothetical protein [Acidobacteriota bacterium]